MTLTASNGVTSVSNTFNIVVSACDPANINLSQGNWYFYTRAGLEFSSGAPVAVDDGQMTTNLPGEACITQSDVNGDLLFYSRTVLE